MMRSGDIPPFGRAVVETTGLADPAPIMQAILSAKEVASRFRLGNVVTTVDGINGAQTLKVHQEARRQAAMADVIILTKCDLTDESARTSLQELIAECNPNAALQ